MQWKGTDILKAPHVFRHGGLIKWRLPTLPQHAVPSALLSLVSGCAAVLGCSVARPAPSAAAAPRRLGCSDDYKRAHCETGLERGRTRQAFVSRHAHMDGGHGSIHGGGTDPYMGAGRTIHVSQARQQSVSAGETEDGTGGMAEAGRMAQID